MHKPARTRGPRAAVLGAAGLATALAAAVVIPAVASADPERNESKKPQAVEVEEDFNGDGFQDMAVGAPWSDPEVEGSPGYVTVYYGTADGLDYDNAVTISQETDGVPGDPVEGNGFGSRLMGADLDQDGYTDIAVHLPGADQIVVLWGGKDGIDGAGSAVIDGVENAPRSVGNELTTGDFNGDGNPDLLLERDRGEGVYGVLQGPFDRDGTAADEQQIELTTGYDEVMTVTVGDITGDGADDLVVHQWFEEMARPNLLYLGGENGLEEAGEVPMGASGVIGDFDGDGFGDLAYREVPNGVVENLPNDSGTVKVMYGSAEGPDPDRVQTFTQDSPGVPGADEEGDQFGGKLAAGDVTGDGRDDLAVGVPFEAVGDKEEAGSVVLLKGSEDGLTGTGAQAFHQDTAGVPGVAEPEDRFGSSLRLVDIDGDGHADLTVGAPREAVGDVAEVGAVWYLPGTSDGLTATGSSSVSPTEEGSPVPGGRFGTSLTNAGYAPLMSSS